MHQRLLIIFAALAALTGPAFAGMNGIDCRCIYKGKYFEQGDTVCIRVDGKSHMARCDMALNNTSWTFISTINGCPSAMMTPVPPGLLAPPPTDTAKTDRPVSLL